jgi:YfiR/HmsC-like
MALVALLTLSGTNRVPAQGNVSSEYQVKAAFLYHFSQFVDWPEGTFKDATSPLVYCTVGEDPFHGALEASISGKEMGVRPLQVAHFQEGQNFRSCQIVFIGGGEKKIVSSVLASLKGTPVLTVGESQSFVQEGGMIGFLLEENKIRFEINLDAAEHAKLKLSSRLLALAKRVIGGQRGS